MQNRTTSEIKIICLEIFKLFIIFTIINMLIATQDIIIDGWSITLLSEYVWINTLFYFFSEVLVQNSKRGNIEWSSICKNAGTTFGMLTGHPLFLALQSVPISNNYLRYYFNIGQKNVGLINLKGKFNHTRNYSNYFYCFK